MIPSEELYGSYTSAMHKIADLRYASAMLQWDQETYLPPKGATLRGQQIATLSEMAHQLFTDDSLYSLLQELQSREDLSAIQKKNTELTIEDIERQKKLSPAFVRKLSELTQQSFHSWLQARKENDFLIFEPDLIKLFDLKKQEAQLIGFKDHAYDVFLNDHDKGLTVNLLDSIFASLTPHLQALLEQVQKRVPMNDHFLYRHYPKNLQWDFSMELLGALGYDFEAGRQDLAEHPFTINFNSFDVRITTRIDEGNPAGMIWSSIHELGHALYEQGLPPSEYGLPLSEAASISIHESQSRLWENHVGRSLAFCEYILPLLRKYFPEQVKDVSALEFFKAINKVKTSLIRTEADELTYHFHVMIRYQIEKKLFDGSMKVRDIPAYWNELYKDYLALDVPDQKQGCLQDVHWSHGSFGYFPTYSLGSLYGAQFFAEASNSIQDLDAGIRKGQVGALLQWLRNEVYVHGRFYTSEELSKKICGKGLDTSHFMDYLLAKYKLIYEF